MTDERQPIKESLIIFIAGLVQFVNMVDFIMVMPLGPDFAHALGIKLSDIGLIGGSYALAAAAAGLIGSFYLDNYSRKRVLIFFLTGLGFATLGGAIAWSKESMIAARILAGICGGPLGAVSIALVADYIPPQRRGAAMGKVMGAFSLASILGIPAGLEMARLLSWHAPFIATSALCFAALGLVAYLLPNHKPFTNNVLLRNRLKAIKTLLSDRAVLWSYVLMVLSMFAAFILIPNISAHIQINMSYPRAQLGLLYFVGGFISLFTMRWAGQLVDKTSSSLVSVLSTALFTVVAYVGFIHYTHSIPVLVIFTAFMVAMTTRNICGQTLFSKIPAPEFRGAYNSLQNVVIYVTQGIAAWFASIILVEEDGALLNVPVLGWIALVLSLFIPPLFYLIEKSMKTQN